MNAPTGAGVLIRPRLLMLTHRLPYPPDRGDRIRSYHLARTLANYFDLYIASTADERVLPQHEAALRQFATAVAVQPIDKRYSKLKGLAALFTGRPITPAYHFRGALADVILSWHRQKPFDAVLTFCTGMIEYARLIDAPRQVLDLVDVDSLKWQAYAKQTSLPMRWVYAAEAKRLRRIEAGQFDRFDAITVVSEAEAKAYRAHVGEHDGLHAVNNGVDTDYFSPLADAAGRTVVFVGVLNYKPNVDGVQWFVDEVWPSVTGAKLLLVGRDPGAQVLGLGQRAGVTVVGPVSDVRDYLKQASVVIAPLQLARGVQNKVLEAMASQRAVICSPAAAQGIDAQGGEHLVVAESPDQWVLGLHELFDDDVCRRRIAAAARQRVEARYAWSKQLAPMVELLGGAGGEG